jgi:hypothetical protein
MGPTLSRQAVRTVNRYEELQYTQGEKICNCEESFSLFIRVYIRWAVSMLELIQTHIPSAYTL